jgi:hypothetical protein
MPLVILAMRAKAGKIIEFVSPAAKGRASFIQCQRAGLVDSTPDPLREAIMIVA